MNYQRVKISGVIECQNDMAIASGQRDTKTVKPRNKPAVEQTYTEICLDAHDKPYIPASSLRGLLRDLDLTGFRNLSGLFDTNDGVLRFYDAIWHYENADFQKDQIHTRNKINPRTGAAQDKHLYSHAYVPAKSRFICQIEADKISEQKLSELLGVLNSLNAHPFSQLGKHKSKQQGLIKWQKETANVEVLDNAKLMDWLLDGKVNSELSFDKPKDIMADSAFNFKTNLNCFVCIFTPQSPILINDPNRVKEESEQPYLEFYRNTDNQLIIPSSSLMGVMRGQCRKILLTLLMSKEDAEFSQAEKIADDFLGQLFGCTGQRSRVWLTDAIAENSASHLQMFTAIDRFTGGVKDGALYQANAANAGEITTTLYLDQTQKALTESEKGLLILLLRDAMEGDLKVGWGKTKGYGVLQLNEINHNDTKISDWTKFMQQKEEDENLMEIYFLMDDCITALLTELGIKND